MRRRVLLTVPLLLAAVEVYRRGYAAALILGAGMWADALLGYRPRWPEPV